MEKKDIAYSSVHQRNIDLTNDDEHTSTKPESASWIGIIFAFFLNLLLMPFLLLPLWVSFFTVEPKEEVLVLFFGRLNTVYKTAGVHWYNFVGRTIIRISTKTRTYDIKKTTVVDVNGNPIIVSGIVTYRIIDSVRAAFDVQNLDSYLEKQALATLKKVCSRYPYESKDGHSLQKESENVSQEMVEILQQKADICGAKIMGFELTDLQYAPEIAQGMLVRQQAQALLDARKVVVEGAVGIVTTAVASLATNGVKLTDKEQGRLVSNLLAVVCSEAKVQPTISIAENPDKASDNNVNDEILKTLQIMTNQFRMIKTNP